MDTGPTADRADSGPAGGGRFAWRTLALWLPACLVSGAAVAGAAVVAEEKFAPLLIFPLLVGVALGAMTVGLMRLAHVGHRQTVLLGTVLAVAVSVVGQHYLRYRAERKRVQQRAEEYQSVRSLYPGLVGGLEPRPPASLLTYLQAEAKAGRDMKMRGYYARGWVAWSTWALDGLVVLAAALAMVVPATRLPFCNRCGTWYRTLRSGRIDAGTAGRLAELAEIDPGNDLGENLADAPQRGPTAARYRLSACNGGCGPTALDLSWQRSDGAVSSASSWLDAACRDRIMQVLDEPQAEDDNP